MRDPYLATMFALSVLAIGGGVAEVGRLSASPATAPGRPPPEHGYISLPDSKNFFKGSYTAYIAPFGKGALVEERDYTQAIVVVPATFPDATRMEWRWPGPFGGIRSFLAIDYGDYNFTKPLRPITPAKVRDIGVLSETHSMSLGGSTDGFDVIVDFFLTSRASDLKSKLFEIEVFLHTPPYSKRYADSVKALGVYRAPDGRAWRVSRDNSAPNGNDILLYPTDLADIPRGSIDLKDMLTWMTKAGILTGDEYFNGLAIGPEVQQGAGSARIDKLEVSYTVKR